MRFRLATAFLVAICAAQPGPTDDSYARLKPDAFRDLPQAVAAFLGARGCSIPQPSADGAPRNVIHGEFFEKGKVAWAVLCSDRGVSSILVFRGSSDAHPAELARRPDRNYMQGGGDGRFHYSREINAADRNFIVEHYRAYGGPEPPPIDHQGIDDAFVGKASEVYYWYRGEWRKLQGAD